ncbi:MAG: hypothetical protein JWN85_1457 [Gammaproteobacteria bacterium]|nr:hypothetical protein [Gammaproteobacteria bacterium]
MQPHLATSLKARFVSTTLAAACLLLMCTDGTSIAGIQGSGRKVLAVTLGRITGFGSIFVNGIEYATSGAQIRMDDQPAFESQLQVGQIVTVNGNMDIGSLAGTATDVAFSGDVQGPIAQSDAASRTLLVLGQTVRVSDETIFGADIQPAAIESLQAGMVVEVSAFATAAGDLMASRIDLKPVSAGQQVKGRVQSLDPAARTFRINALTIDYSDISPAGSFADGITAAVQGSLSSSGMFHATRVQVSSGAGGTANEKGQIEGLITTFHSESDFELGDQRVVADAATHFVLHGQVLGPDTAVTVRGTFDGAGLLVARKVESKPGSSQMARGLVDSVSLSSGTLNILGIKVTLSGATSVEDKSAQRLRPFGLRDVRAGDYLEVHGIPGASGSGLVATLIEREQPDSSSELQGVALNVADSSFTLLGVTVLTNAQTRFVGFPARAGAAGTIMTDAAGSLVRVQGSLSGNTLIAAEVSSAR